MDTVIELEGPTAARTERWAKRILGTSCLVLLATGLLGLAVVGNTRGVSPAKELARVQAFVERATSARLTATTTSESFDGEGDLGSSYKDTSRMTGSIVLPDRSQWIEEDGISAWEGITVPGATYYREADSREELAAEQWAYQPLDEERPPIPVMAAELMPVAEMSSAFGPSELPDLLTAAGAPTRVGPHTIKVTIDVKQLAVFENMPEEMEEDFPVPTITAELTSTSDGRLDRLVMRTSSKDPEMGSSSSTTDIRLTNWGAALTIVAPDAAAIDPTPGISENDLATFDATPLFGLRRLPAGYELMQADVWMSEEDADEEAGDCPEVSLSYANPAEMEAFDKAMAKVRSEADYDTLTEPVSIEVSLTPADCESWSAIEDGEAITLGGRPATIVRGTATDEEYATSIQLVVGATRVLIESDGPEAATIAAASDVVPFDLATQPVHRPAPPVG